MTMDVHALGDKISDVRVIFILGSKAVNDPSEIYFYCYVHLQNSLSARYQSATWLTVIKFLKEKNSYESIENR